MLDAVYLIEATDFEQHSLWRQHACESDNSEPICVTWERLNPGHIEQVGSQVSYPSEEPNPINVQLTWARINGQQVCFYTSNSRCVNWKFIEEWLDKKFTCQRTDANNFHLCLQHIKDMNTPKCPLCGSKKWCAEGAGFRFECGTLLIKHCNPNQSPWCKKLPQIREIVAKLEFQSGAMDQLRRWLAE